MPPDKLEGPPSEVNPAWGKLMKSYNLIQKIMNKAVLLLNRDGPRKDKASNKVFAVGFNKTGTTSLDALFKSLGLTAYHGVKWRTCDDLELLRSYDCFSDGIPKDLPLSR